MRLRHNKTRQVLLAGFALTNTYEWEAVKV